MTNTDASKRIEARNLYHQAYNVAEISKRLDVPYGTVDAWKRRDKWDDTPLVVKMESAVDVRLLRLIAKEDKTATDLKEIDQLGILLERTSRIQKYDRTGKEADLNPNIENRNDAKKQKAKAKGKNALTDEQVQMLVKAFEDGLYGYQIDWGAAKKYRERNILKSR